MPELLKHRQKLLVTLQKGEDSWIVAECPSIPGCMSQGKTEAAALRNIRSAIRVCLKARKEQGLPPTIEIREVEIAV